MRIWTPLLPMPRLDLELEQGCHMGVPIRSFLKSRRDRMVGSILGHAERELKPSLTDAQWTAFRNNVMDASNSFYDVVLDLWKGDDDVRNEAVLEVLEQVQQELARRHAPEPIQTHG